MRGWGAADLPEEYPVDCDGEKRADGSEGEELLKELVVGLLRLKYTEGRDDETVGVEAISEERLLDGIFEGGCPD